MEHQPRIAAVVVTYNRPALLLSCLESIQAQSKLPDEIFIIDNKSAAETQELLRTHGYVAGDAPQHTELGLSYQTRVQARHGELAITYLYKHENDGGAGGFYAGMRLAYDAGYDWLWMMDDDGLTDADELAELLDKCCKYDIPYANALVISSTDHRHLSFPNKKYTLTSQLDGLDIVTDLFSPFNGTFIRRDVIDRIGMIKREMFIWGDEVEYSRRVAKGGFKSATVCTAKHYHPTSRSEKMYICPFLPIPGTRIVVKVASGRSRIFYRNRGYIYATYHSKIVFWRWLLYNTIAYATRLRLKEVGTLFKYALRGARNDFRLD